MPYSNLSTTFDVAALTPIMTQANALQTALATHSINLTPTEVQGLYKMNENRQSLGSRAIQIANDNPTLVPAYLNLAEARKDMDRYTNLFAIQAKLEAILAGVKDGRTASGSEVMLFVKGFYNALGGAAEQNVPGAKALYDEMKVYFDLPPQPDGGTPDPTPVP